MIRGNFIVEKLFDNIGINVGASKMEGVCIGISTGVCDDFVKSIIISHVCEK